MLLAGIDDPRHPFEYLGVFVLAWIAELLREIAFADQYGADARHLLEDLRQRLDAAHVLHHQDYEDLTFGAERPYVGAVVVVLLRESPVPHRGRWPVAADAGWLIVRQALAPRIAACGNGVIGFLHRGDVRPHYSINAKVERLLGMELSFLGSIRRNAHHRGDPGRGRAGLCDLSAIEHVLQTIAQCPYVPGIVLHLKHETVVLGGGHGNGSFGIGLAKRRECVIDGLQVADHAIEARDVSHALSPAV